jgi:hypothetical protein
MHKFERRRLRVVSIFAKQTCFVGKKVTSRLHFDEGLILARQWTLTSMMRKPVVHRYMTTQIDAKTSDRESLVTELAAKLVPRNAFALAA